MAATGFSNRGGLQFILEFKSQKAKAFFKGRKTATKAPK